MVHSSLPSACALALLCVAASAQTAQTPQRTTAPIRDRGTYHLATGTWTRTSPSNSFNSEVLFNNTAVTGYFFGMTAGLQTVDHGRIPSTSSPVSPDSVVGNADVYTIDCFSIAYCSSIPTAAGGVDFAISFYDNYAPCTDVDLMGGADVVAGFSGTGLFGGSPSSSQGCWIASFDLSNTTTTFVLNGDADRTWDGIANSDSFGWGLEMTNSIDGPAGNGTGPLVSGKCPIGGVTLPQRGFGTKFGGTPGRTDATGLGTSDFFWIDSAALGTSMSPNGGCFFFGGCGDPFFAQSNPYASFWLQLFGSKGDGPGDRVGTPYCSSTTNASGSRAIMGAFGEPAADLSLSVTGLPNSTGQLFFGTMGFTSPGMAMLGDGPLCAAMGIVRINPFLSAGMMMNPANAISFTLNYTAPYAASFTGTRYFQHWFRSTLSTGTGSNGSSGIRVDF